MARRSRKKDQEQPRVRTHYTIALEPEQIGKLEEICDRRIYGYYSVDHAHFAFRSEQDKVNIVAYKSGKLVVQGKGTEDFVRDVLEAEITGDPQLGYDEVHHPEWFKAHAGLDEAGKGDLFGPVVAACVVADGEMVRAWMEAGVRDSKRIADIALLKLEKVIKATKGVVVRTAFCGMPKYNQLMGKPKANLNLLIAWLHARALEEALKIRRVPWGMLDQFSKRPLVQNYFTEKDRSFKLSMQVRAESDPVVAAASICARAEYLRQLKLLSEEFGEPLKKGAGVMVKAQARALVKKIGSEALGNFAKLHFRTSYEVLGLPVPERRKWSAR